MKRNSRRAGISLVALVITIIVLIILTGAVIVTFMEGGIIDRAKEAVFKNDMRTYQEILALKRAENQMEIALGSQTKTELNASDLEDIQEIIPEFKEEYEGIVVITDGELSIGERVNKEELSSSEELYATWLSDLGIGLSRLPQNALVSHVKVGDYVDYNPEGGTYTIAQDNRSWMWNENGTDSDYAWDYDSGEEVVQYQDINWRVLKNDGRQVTLISAEPIDNIYLYGPTAVSKGPAELDKICETLYGGRNLKIEDINEVMGIDIESDIRFSYDVVLPGVGPESRYLDGVATFGDVLDAENWGTSGFIMPDENYREYELHYYYNIDNYKTTENEVVYNIILRDADNINNNMRPYWLSSNCVSVQLENSYETALFQVRYVEDGNATKGCDIHASMQGGMAEGGMPGLYGLRPVVTLNSNTEITNPSAGGDSINNAWIIK